METPAVKATDSIIYKFKEVRKEIADKLDQALSDHKIILGAEKIGKHIKKMSKTLAEEIVKTANKKAKKKDVKKKKESSKKK